MDRSTLVWVCLAALLIGVAVMFVVLFMQTMYVRTVHRQIERQRYASPDELVNTPDLDQCVRAFAVVADLNACRRLQRAMPSPKLGESVRTVCRDGTSRLVYGAYRKVYWLALRAEDGLANELADLSLQGKARYAAIAGTIVRMHMLTERLPVAVDAAKKALGPDWRAKYIIFLVSPAFNMDLDPWRADKKAGHGDWYQNSSAKADGCEADVALPIASDPSRLAALLARTSSEVMLHVWAYGAGAGP